MEEEGSLAVGRAGVQQRLAEMGCSSETDRAGVWLSGREPAQCTEASGPIPSSTGDKKSCGSQEALVGPTGY